MNREIKFRVWCQDYQEWEKDPCVIDRFGTIYHILKDGTLRAIRPYKHVVQFYTGLKDKNGNEIYEGDILAGRFDLIRSVVFEHGKFMLKHGECLHDLSGEQWTSVIIGNIYENPELLKSN